MTSLHNAFGMLVLAGLMLALSAYCFGLFRRPEGARHRGRRMAWPLVLAAALPGAALAQAASGSGPGPGRGAASGATTSATSSAGEPTTVEGPEGSPPSRS